MIVLGVHGGPKRDHEDNRIGFAMHDSAALLLRDAQVLSAIEEERLNRIKHTNCFPVSAIKYCLNENRMTLADVDYIAINCAEHIMDIIAKRNFLANARLKGPVNGRSYLAYLFAREFDIDVTQKIRFCRHHVAHAWSAYAPSGYDSSLILVLDGDGDNLSGMVLSVDGNKMTKIWEYGLEQSLGNFYTDMIALLGYSRFDEYKVMGLAPYGNPEKYGRLFEKFYRLLPAGNYQILDPNMIMMRLIETGIVDKARRKGEPFNETHKDLAAALQVTLEKIVFHVLNHFQKETRQKRLCFAGGVAHNCTLNGKILYSDLFDDVFVQPAAHDAGSALGAAISVFYDESSAHRPQKLQHLFYGTEVGNGTRPADEIETVLSRWGDFLSFEKVDDITVRTAQLLGEGSVVGWVQGRSEFGPRALGNRSILADPRPASNKLQINQMVKKREEYRPFAPSVLEESLADYFEVPSTRAEYPFMIFVLNVREQFRELLGAITHIDGTARIQTVSRQTNPKYWALINEFQKLTGVPILLNTSFNNNAEPIVDSVEDAIVCYLTTGLHYLVIGDYLARKKEIDSGHAALETLAPGLPNSRRLVKRKGQTEGGGVNSVFEIEGTMSHFFARTVIEVSPDVFSILMDADGKKSLKELIEENGIDDNHRRARVREEMFDLWTQRIIILRPQHSH
ncbi:MAG TPA: carbamoyltransferase C-terminal domain-containing protein [Pyrinomonadaceae bacterium]|nr:carbamoyltransferase C-terminal domain-containing protein [Pyrinomonadaceae bacterium]